MEQKHAISKEYQINNFGNVRVAEFIIKSLIIASKYLNSLAFFLRYCESRYLIKYFVNFVRVLEQMFKNVKIQTSFFNIVVIKISKTYFSNILDKKILSSSFYLEFNLVHSK